MQIGVVGLGRMGANMSRRLMRAGLVWLVATVICYMFAADIYQFFLRPLAAAFPDDG